MLKYIKLFFSFLLLIPIRFYQLVISPYTTSSCRHIPSCSKYSVEAIKTHGPIGGLWLGTKRILKCHPWGTEGLDPVPPKGAQIYTFKSIKNEEEEQEEV